MPTVVLVGTLDIRTGVPVRQGLSLDSGVDVLVIDIVFWVKPALNQMFQQQMGRECWLKLESAVHAKEQTPARLPGCDGRRAAFSSSASTMRASATPFWAWVDPAVPQPSVGSFSPWASQIAGFDHDGG